MKKEVETSLREIILEICEWYKTMTESEIYALEGWCVYSVNENPNLDAVCYIDDYPDIDDDDNEIPVSFIEENGLEYYCSDENVIDVVGASLHQKENASVEEMMNALEFYLEKDTFLELQNDSFIE